MGSIESRPNARPSINISHVGTIISFFGAPLVLIAYRYLSADLLPPGTRLMRHEYVDFVAHSLSTMSVILTIIFRWVR